MELRSSIKMMAAISILMSISGGVFASQSQDRAKTPSASAEQVKIAGILTDRLTRSDLRIWNSIRDIVFAKDKSGRIKHPKLLGLWNEAERSGHAIIIELSHDLSFSRAGLFRIETVDPTGQRHVASILLNLTTIDQTYVRKNIQRADPWVPFTGLENKERYAEVLGHELAHAVKAFQDAGYLQLHLEMARETAGLRYGPGGLENAAGEEERLARIAQLSRMIEEPAEAMEMAIWLELSAAIRYSRVKNRT
jgi:hypothetical protein